MNPIKLILIGLAMTALTACSKTVEWEEEVPLNTGETIVVKRTVPWELQGGAGNPLDIDMRPNLSQQVLQFTYQGKNYSYSGGAGVLWLVINKKGVPNLVARPDSLAWASRNNYYCVTPYYVQFKPDDHGKNWTWPKRIEPWLYNQPYNIMAVIPQLDEDRKKRYSHIDRLERDKTYQIQSPNGIRISGEYVQTDCLQDPAVQNLTTPSWSQK